MPPAELSAGPLSTVAHEHFVVVPELWLDECCEQVGLLHTLLRVFSGIEQMGEIHSLVTDAVDCCENLQELLNSIPVLTGAAPPQQITHLASSSNLWRDVEPHFQPELCGDNFPVIAAEEDEQIPAFDEDRLAEHDSSANDSLRDLLFRFHQQASGDLRELELLSLGHHWTRMAPLAAGLKAAAARVSAYRIVVDAAALEGALRTGRQHDINLALDALRADLRDCARQREECVKVEVEA